MRSWVVGIGLLLCGCGPAPQEFAGTGRLQALTLQPGQVLRATVRDCALTLQGSGRQVQLLGDDNYCRIQGKIGRLKVEGRRNQVECAQPPEVIELGGSGNRVQVTLSPGQPRPQMRVEGVDQNIGFSPPKGP